MSAANDAILDELADLIECIQSDMTISGLDEVHPTSTLGEVLKSLMSEYQKLTTNHETGIEPYYWNIGPNGPYQVGGLNQQELRQRILSKKAPNGTQAPSQQCHPDSPADRPRDLPGETGLDPLSGTAPAATQ